MRGTALQKGALSAFILPPLVLLGLLFTFSAGLNDSLNDSLGNFSDIFIEVDDFLNVINETIELNQSINETFEINQTTNETVNGTVEINETTNETVDTNITGTNETTGGFWEGLEGFVDVDEFLNITGNGTNETAYNETNETRTNETSPIVNQTDEELNITGFIDVDVFLNITNATSNETNITDMVDISGISNISAIGNLTIKVNPIVRDSSGKLVNITYEVFKNKSLVEKNIMKSDIYTIVIRPVNHIIRELRFSNMSLTKNISELVEIEQADGRDEFLFSVNPLVNNTNITIIAKGTPLLEGEEGFRILEKCADWDFETSSCYGEWVPYAAMKADGTYEFSIDAKDPGFAEGISNCVAEAYSIKGSWDSACDGTYPGSCGAGGDLLRCNDAQVEAHGAWSIFGGTRYAGVQIQEFNSSITDCKNVTNIEVCYEWWINTGTGSDCDISVDADGGGSWSAATTACPGAVANPGIACINVTGLETWTCDNFFGSGGTRARVKSEATASGLFAFRTYSWDVLFLNVSYIAYAPNVTIVYPSDGATYNTKDLFIRESIAGSHVDSCWYVFNGGGSIPYICGSEPNITAVEGPNNLTVFVNNTDGETGNDSISFTVNTSIDLTISITSPANDTFSTSATPKLKLLAVDSMYNSINYTLYIYYASNGSLYAVGNNGTLTNDTESEIVLSPALTLIGNSTEYKIVANATDAGGENATSNILFYTIGVPAVELISPENNYWDDDGNISFSFKVYDPNFPTINCSLYIDGSLEQTNATTNASGVTTTFDVTGISDGANKEWKVFCIDADNNTGEDIRNFSVDTTAPVINWVNDTPDPVPQGNTTNITANITDNLGLKTVTVNISGTVYFMDYGGGDIYYYEYCTCGLSGNYSYTVNAIDNADNPAAPQSGNFTVEVACGEINTSLTLTSNITSMGTCFNITADDVTLDCAGNMIVGDGTGYGIVMENRTNVTVKNCKVGQFHYGIASLTTDSLLENITFWNNYRYDLLVNTTSNVEFNMSDIYFLNPLMTLENYSLLDINDSVSANSAYSINWTANSTVVPKGYVSFRKKFVNITAHSGAVSIDSIVWRWLDSELTGYNESTFELWRWNGTNWSMLNNTPDTSANKLAQFNMNPASDYGILGDDNESPVINSVFDNPDPVPRNDVINISANVTDNVLVGKVWVEVNGTNYTMTHIGGDIWRYGYDTDNLSLGIYNYTVYANDSVGNNATPLNGSFNVTTPEFNDPLRSGSAFLVYVPPTHDSTIVAPGSPRIPVLVVTAFNDNTSIYIEDLDGDGDSDDSVGSESSMVTLDKGESRLVFISNGTDNDEDDGDYMYVESSDTVTTTVVTKSVWNAYTAAAEGRDYSGEEYYIYGRYDESANNTLDIVIFAHQDDTHIRVYDITGNISNQDGIDENYTTIVVDDTEGILINDVTIDKGEHISYINNSFLPGGHTAKIVSNRRIGVIAGAFTEDNDGRDGGFYVGGTDGKTASREFYTYVGRGVNGSEDEMYFFGTKTADVTVRAYDENGTLNATYTFQLNNSNDYFYELSYTGSEPYKYITSSQKISILAGTWVEAGSGDIADFAPEVSGSGVGRNFNIYVPEPSGKNLTRAIVFAYQNDTFVEIYNKTNGYYFGNRTLNYREHWDFNISYSSLIEINTSKGVAVEMTNYDDNVAFTAVSLPFRKILVTKTSDKDVADIGENVTYYVNISNPYNVDFYNVSITDVLETGILYLSSSASSGVSGPAVQNDTPDENSTTLLWNISVIDAGETKMITINARINTTDYVQRNFVEAEGFDQDGAFISGSDVALIFLLDDEPPKITNVTDTPDPQFVNNTVNITAVVTDNWWVSEVYVEINGTNYSMTKDGGDLYYYEYNGTVVGVYNYKIWAIDSSNNINVSTGHTLSIIDVYCYISGTITDAFGSNVFSRTEIYYSGESALLQNSTETYNFPVACGRNYTFRVVPDSGNFTELVMCNLSVIKNITEVVDLEDSPEDMESPDGYNWTEAIAWSPNASLNYTSIRVNMTYSGSNLAFYKCSNWNYTSRNCTDDNWTYYEDVPDGTNSYSRTFAAGDPGGGIKNKPNVTGYIKIYDVTGLNSTGRRNLGVFLGNYFNGTQLNLTSGKSYRIEIHLNNSDPNTNGIIRDPWHDNIPEELAVDMNGLDGPNVTVVAGAVTINPFVPTNNPGTEAGTRRVTWDANPPHKLIESLETGDIVKLWYVVDYNTTNESLNNLTFYGDVQGTNNDVWIINPISTNLSIETWHIFYGDISGSLLLAPDNSTIFYNWAWNGQAGKVYAINGDASINWINITALGRTGAGAGSANDFTELDSLLNMTGSNQSIETLYSTDGSSPLETRNMTLYKKFTPYIPVANSTNSSSYKTGIAWDASQDVGDGQFDAADNEDVVFVTEINSTAANDYEIRVPGTLDTYKGASGVVEFWVELE